MAWGYRAALAAGLAAGCLTAAAPAFAIFPEEQVATETLADVEFDSARDGTYCASCNFGAGNSRVTYVDLQFRVIVAPVELGTGKLLLDKGQVVDTNAAFVTDYGNGPSWMFSQRGSELVYTRYVDGKPRRDRSAGIAFAKQIGPNEWQAGFIRNGLGRVSPKSTTDVTDPVPRLSYGDVSKPKAYWEFAETPTVEHVLPGDDSNRGVTLRWVPGSPEIIYSYTPPGETANQIFVYNTDTLAIEQISRGAGVKRAQFMSYAPDFGGQAIAFMVVDDTRFDLYKRVVDGNGVASWVLFHTITMPSATPYVSGSPEAFVHNGRTWILLGLREKEGLNVPSNLALLSPDPARPELRMLTDRTSPIRWRSDPEYYIAADSVYIYYTRALPYKYPTVGEGMWRVNTGLGPQLP